MPKKPYGDKPIIDATGPLTTRVMPKHIKVATPRNETCCALAQSVKTKKGVLSVRVGAEIVLVEYKDKVMRYQLSSEDKKKIRDFDIANYFRPDTYTFLPPKKKLGSRKGTKPGSNVRKGEAKTVYNAPPLRHAFRHTVDA